jgi:hypothetical protein
MALDYWELIYENRKKIDYIKWILCDKYVAKMFAQTIGFKISKTFQLIEKVSQIDFDFLNNNTDNKYVIKPTDLCDSKGVFLMKDNINLINGKKTTTKEIISQLENIRSKIHHEYYMHELMYDFKVPFKGYIVEELLLNERGEIPTDFKCYTFNGRVFLIANTYNRKTENNKQTFNSIWITRSGYTIPIPMIKKNYRYIYHFIKPKGYTKMINLVEKASRILQRHCRIDVYLIDGKVYFGEFTFFGGAFLHTRFANLLLGIKWLLNPDNINSENDKKINNVLKDIVPKFYTNPN